MDPGPPPVPFANDGSFMEKFQQMRQEPDQMQAVVPSRAEPSKPKPALAFKLGKGVEKAFVNGKLAFSLKAKPKLVVNPLKGALAAEDEEEEEEVRGQVLKRQKVEATAEPGSVPGRQSGPPPPPSDPEVRKVADRLAMFVAKNGRAVEDVTRQRNPGDTPFRFLFDASCPEYKYYEYCIFEAEKALGKAADNPPLPSSQPPLAQPRLSTSSHIPSLPPPSGQYKHSLVPLAPGQPAPDDRQQSAISPTTRRPQLASGRGGDSAEDVKDPVAMMEFYMRKAAQQERFRPMRHDSREMPPPENLNIPSEPGRRGHHMGDFIPEDEMSRFLAKCGGDQGAADYDDPSRIKADNVGHKLLSKMGWTEGSGLGSGGGGMIDPLAAKGVKPNNLGVGAAETHEVSTEDDIYEQYKKRMMLGYRFRPNPLNNPRKAYY